MKVRDKEEEEIRGSDTENDSEEKRNEDERKEGKVAETTFEERGPRR